MKYAPIALFTYSRADHTRQAVESLLQNAEAKDSDLYIFSDGPKTEEKRAAVEENRKYIHTITGFKSVTIVEREKNWGLANSLIAGITDIVNKYGRVIVVEDDLVLSPYFLKFMNDGLDKYKNDDRIGAISAFVYPVEEELPNTFFLKYFNCWGWAIWKRSWDLLEKDAKKLLYKIRFKRIEFDLGGGAGNYGNLYCQKVGLVDSWWVRLYASLFLLDKLTLYPGISLSSNRGFDGSGTHTKSNCKIEAIKVDVADKTIEIDDIKIEQNPKVYDIYKNYFMKDKKINTFSQFKSFVRRVLCIDYM